MRKDTGPVIRGSERGAALLETALFLAAFLVATIAVVAFLEASARDRVREGSSLYAEYDLSKR